MSGISYVLDSEGAITPVLLDLKRHGRMWEDSHDGLIVASRKREPRVSLAAMRRRLELKQKIDA